VDDIGLNCPCCRYNLTGLTRDVCPECGTAFDLELLRNDQRYRRRGTPVYGKRRLELITGTIETLFLLLFRPRSFALRVRDDEPLGPAVVVFLVALVLTLWRLLAHGTPWLWSLPRHWREAVVVVAVVGSLVLAVAFVFAASSTSRTSWAWTLRRRFRFWCMVAMYSTIFLPLWMWFCAGSYPLPWQVFTTHWLFFGRYVHTEVYLAMILILWWTFTISVVLWYRVRPRWLAIVLMLAAFLFVRASVQIVDGSIPRLSR
jgi:hypothetical protein